MELTLATATKRIGAKTKSFYYLKKILLKAI